MLNIIKDHFSTNTAVGIDHTSFKHFEQIKDQICDDIIQKVGSHKYHFTRYKELLMVKDRLSLPRCISIPTLRDRLCLDTVLDELKDVYSDAETIVKPPLPQKVISELSKNIKKPQYTAFIKMDITHFFDNINHYRLFKLIEDNQKVSPELFAIIKSAVRNPTTPTFNSKNIGVPQGLPISNILSQIYMNDLLPTLKKKLPDTYIVRYVDDILILCKNKDLAFSQTTFINLIEETYMLAINKKKIKSGKLINDEFNFLGYRFYPSRTKQKRKQTLLSVKTSSIKKLQERLIRTMTHYKRNVHDHKGLNIKALQFELNVMISGSISEQYLEESDKMYVKRYGWIFFFSQITDYSVLYSLDAFVKAKLHHIFPDADGITVNSFVKSFRDVKYNTFASDNIFYPDRYTLKQKKEFLSDIAQVPQVNMLTEEKVTEIFRVRAFRLVKRNEQDLVNGFS